MQTSEKRGLYGGVSYGAGWFGYTYGPSPGLKMHLASDGIDMPLYVRPPAVHASATSALLSNASEAPQHLRSERLSAAVSSAGVSSAGTGIGRARPARGMLKRCGGHISNYLEMASSRRVASVAALALLPAAVSGWALAARPRGFAAGGRSPCMTASEAPPTAGELKDELLDLLGDVVDRGIDAPTELAEDLLEVVGELGETSPPDDWSRSPDLGGRWRLRYTSSKTFANNRGLSGYARDLAGVETPELLMRVETTYKRLQYEEPLELASGSLAAMVGNFASADAVVVDCTYTQTRDDVMAVVSQTVTVGSRSWEPADRQLKAVRALGAGLPVFLDAQLLVLRSQPDYIVWIFERA